MSNVIVARLLAGDDLKKSILHLCADRLIGAGAVVCAVGSLSRAHMRLAGAAESMELLEELEVISLMGTVSASACHLHVSVANGSGQVFGGHLLEGCEVRTTVELIISSFDDLEFRRERDPDTGFDELVVIRSDRTRVSQWKADEEKSSPMK